MSGGYHYNDDEQGFPQVAVDWRTTGEWRLIITMIKTLTDIGKYVATVPTCYDKQAPPLKKFGDEVVNDEASIQKDPYEQRRRLLIFIDEEEFGSCLICCAERKI